MSRMEDIRYSTPWLSTYRKKTWTTIKETTRRIQSWGRNRSFTGLISCQEESRARARVCTYVHSYIQHTYKHRFKILHAWLLLPVDTLVQFNTGYIDVIKIMEQGVVFVTFQDIYIFTVKLTKKAWKPPVRLSRHSDRTCRLPNMKMEWKTVSTPPPHHLAQWRLWSMVK